MLIGIVFISLHTWLKVSCFSFNCPNAYPWMWYLFLSEAMQLMKIYKVKSNIWCVTLGQFTDLSIPQILEWVSSRIIELFEEGSQNYRRSYSREVNHLETCPRWWTIVEPLGASKTVSASQVQERGGRITLREENCLHPLRSKDRNLLGNSEFLNLLLYHKLLSKKSSRMRLHHKDVKT